MTEEKVADFLWSKIGLNLDTQAISAGDSFCFAVISREVLADFRNRLLEPEGIRVKAGIDKKDQPNTSPTRRAA
jgi:hypothetical protein